MPIEAYIIIDSITTISLIVLMIVALSNGGHKLVANRVYAMFSVVVAMWIFSTHLSNNLDISYKVAKVLHWIVFGSSFAVSILLMKMVAYISKSPKDERTVSRLGWIMWPWVLISMTPLVVKDIAPQEQTYGVIFGPLVWVYGALVIFNICFSLFIIGKGIITRQDIVRKRLMTVGGSLLVAAPLTVIFQFILPATTGEFVFSQFGMIPIFIFAVALYYTVVRHQLFDIKLVAMRTVGYSLTIVTMAGIYVGLAYAVSLVFFRGQIVDGVSFSPLNIALALVLAFVFQPIKRFFDKVTNKLFYRGEYNRDTFFKEFGRILSHDTDLKLLLRQAGEYLETHLKADSVFFALSDLGIYANGHSKSITMTYADVEEIEKHYKNSTSDHESIELDSVDNQAIKEIMLRHNVHIILPLISKNRILGFLFLGEHKARGYSRRDITVLESIVNELTIAIQNSISVEEIRELNATLQQSINEATKELRTKNRQLRKLDEVKDEFLSIASHQLRTPLTSIKGYVDMLLEGDFGEISKRQREVLDDVFSSSERMVQLINDFLNVSRIQTGKFILELRPTDLIEMVQKEVRLMASSLEQRNLQIDLSHDKVIPPLNIDPDKLRQVIVNMIDNAVYYSKPNTVIKIALKQVDKHIVFTVTDTGIGVPAKEQAHLFGKFFRASNARKRRPDGTGVGLYLSKKIVSDHGGEVIFKSTEGKGSTFGFRLPIKS